MDQRSINSQTRADTYGMRPDLFAKLSGNMVKKDDLDALMPNWGERFIPDGLNASGSMFLPFTGSNVEPRGCHYPEEDGIVLDTVGLWNVSCMTSTAVSQIISLNMGRAWIKLEAFDPDGNFVQRKQGGIVAGGVLDTNSNMVYMSMLLPVPRPGYRVRVWQDKYQSQSVVSAVGPEMSTLTAQYVYNGSIL